MFDVSQYLSHLKKRSHGQRRSRRDPALLRRIAWQASPYWPHLSGIFLLGLLASPIALLTPLPLKIAVDSVIGRRPLPALLDAVMSRAGAHTASGILVLAVLLLVATAILSQTVQLATSLLGTYTGEKLVLDFRARLFERVQQLSVSYHDLRGSADSMYRIQTDATAFQYITIDGFLPFVSAGCSLVAMIYVTARLDWELALIAICTAPFLVALSMKYRPLLRERSREVRSLETSALSVVQEVLSAIRVVQAFGAEDHEHKRYLEKSKEGMRARVRLAFAEGSYGLFVGTVTVMGTAVVLWLGVTHVQAQILSLGDLLLIMGYLAQLYEPLRVIGRKSASVQRHLASLERAFALLDAPPGVVERPDARPVLRATGSISFREIDFSYSDERPVLHGVSFDVPPGARIGIAGKTGAGKTTLLSLLTRFYDPTSGAILLDGVDLRDYRLRDLRNQFAVVLQEPILFSTSVAENIAYSKPSADRAEIIAAAKAANAHEFIRELPEGYDTLVGERGARLSGGERQRISLARAFLKDAPILLLDEPTSSIDVMTEALIMEALARLMKGRTTFMIAHRLATLENCDLRLLLDNGRVVRFSSADANEVRSRASIAS